MMRNVGFKVRDARLRQRLSQYQLADLSGVSRKQIINIEQGVASPRIDTLIRLCTVLNMEVNINELTGRKGSRQAARGNRSRT